MLTKVHESFPQGLPSKIGKLKRENAKSAMEPLDRLISWEHVSLRPRVSAARG